MRVILLLIAIVPMAALGWGRTGHQTVCQIAYDELNSSDRAEVDRLIDLDPDYNNFADSCLFADGPPRIRSFDHYLNVPRSFRAITTSECPMADTCLFNAIDIDVGILNDATRSDADKLLALKLLGHWVGDMHQPLHVSYQDDRGGNSIAKKGDPDGSNLHAVWDFDIIERRIGSDFAQIAATLRAEINEGERASWAPDSPVEWANESYQITISPMTGYCTLKHGACWYSADNMILNNGEPWREVVASEQYYAAQQATIELRLKQAGVRLAALLAVTVRQGREEIQE